MFWRTKNVEVKPQTEAFVSLKDAGNIGKVATMFGANTQREAFRHPGPFGRPFVGKDSGYFQREATRILNLEIKKDAELAELYRRAKMLTQAIGENVTAPYPIELPSLAVAEEMPDVIREIRDRIEQKRIQLPLSGERLESARAVSSFALRVITSPLTADHKRVTELLGGREPGALFGGIDPAAEVNSAGYWTDVQVALLMRQPTEAFRQ